MLVIRNRRQHVADSSFAVWSPQRQNRRSVVSSAILIPTVCRAWTWQESMASREERRKSGARAFDGEALYNLADTYT